MLDGELYNHDFKDDFESIISMVRKTKPTDEARLESAKHVQFHCYDLVDINMEFSLRNKWLSKHVPLSYCVKAVNTWIVNETQANKIHTVNLKNGVSQINLTIKNIYQK